MDQQKYYCDTCGAEVARNASRCPDCGRIFTSVRCPRCGHSGPLSDFSHGCPVCGNMDTDRGRSDAPESTQRREAAPPLPIWVWLASLFALLAALAAVFLSGM